MLENTNSAATEHHADTAETANPLHLDVHFPVYQFESVEIDHEGEIIKKKRA